jgi:ANTAR domain/GAF domain
MPSDSAITGEVAPDGAPNLPMDSSALSLAAALGVLRRQLPLATLLTSSDGTILEASAAARSVLRAPRGPLPGQQILTLVAAVDRARMHRALADACRRDDLVQAKAMLAPRTGDVPTSSHLALIREPDLRVPGSRPDLVENTSASNEGNGPATVRWLILPDYESAEQAPTSGQLEALTRLCQLRVDAESDLQLLLDRVVQLCRQAIPDADDVSLVIGSPGEPTLTVATSAQAQHLDGLQHRRGCGPALDAYRSHRPVALGAPALTGHPGLSNDSHADALTSLLAVPLISHGHATGVLTLYGRRSQRLATLMTLREAMPFVEAAQTLARQTQSHHEMRRTHEQLQSALISRAVIDQAKGMLMAMLTCDADEAFEHLSRLSSNRHAKLRDVAQAMVDRSGLPG